MSTLEMTQNTIQDSRQGERERERERERVGHCSRAVTQTLLEYNEKYLHKL